MNRHLANRHLANTIQNRLEPCEATDACERGRYIYDSKRNLPWWIYRFAWGWDNALLPGSRTVPEALDEVVKCLKVGLDG